jgi:hypothetical protein
MGHPSLLNDSGICREVGKEVVECHMRAMPTLSADDGPRFHTNVPISELIEHDTLVVEASVVSLAPPVAKTEDGVTCETRPTPIRPQGAWGLELPDPRSRDQGSKAGP